MAVLGIFSGIFGRANHQNLLKTNNCLVGPTTKTKSKRCSTSLTRIRTGENHCFVTIIISMIIPAMSIIPIPILIITRFISPVELGKVFSTITIISIISMINDHVHHPNLTDHQVHIVGRVGEGDGRSGREAFWGGGFFYPILNVVGSINIKYNSTILISIGSINIKYNSTILNIIVLWKNITNFIITFNQYHQPLFLRGSPVRILLYYADEDRVQSVKSDSELTISFHQVEEMMRWADKDGDGKVFSLLDILDFTPSHWVFKIE